jgi:ferrochelatase
MTLVKDSTKDIIGVVLLNLGGPEKLEDVEPFLCNLFSDRQIIRLGPAFLQKIIARFIARRRAPKSRESYQKIGGGSPLTRITSAQGAALEKELAGYGPYRVYLAMRYWHPLVIETLDELLHAGIKKIIALPLYPHYSVATSGSSLDDLRKATEAFGADIQLAEITGWPTQPQYIDCLAANIKAGRQRFAADEEVRVVYSAHSLPKKFIDEGDPYVDHLLATIGALEAKTGLKGKLCYQSRSGPVEWLSPSTPEMLKKLADAGTRQILMVPISFVSDHVETLYEIDILYRQMAADLGIRLERTESLNVQPEFIQALKTLTLEAAAEKGWVEGHRV